MDNDLFRRIRSSLETKHFKTNDSWLQGCIEYFADGHANPQQQEIIEFVIGQFQLSDLREISNENGCLPRNLSAQKYVELKGSYIVQVDKMYDISTSKFKQLEKIKKVSTENVDATERENATDTQNDKMQSFEPKPKRMFYFYVTDGVQDVLAMEYQPIRSLSESLIPGFKIMIKGPVPCRRGMIMLEQCNFQKIGGEVANILITNAPENIFARALNLPENPKPYGDESAPSIELQSSVPENGQNENTNIADEDFEFDADDILQIEARQGLVELNKKVVPRATTSSNNFISSTSNSILRSSSNFRQTNLSSYYKVEGPNIIQAPKNNQISEAILSQLNDEDDAMFDQIDENNLMENVVNDKFKNQLPNNPVSQVPIVTYDLTADLSDESREPSPKKKERDVSHFSLKHKNDLINISSKQPSPPKSFGFKSFDDKIHKDNSDDYGMENLDFSDFDLNMMSGKDKSNNLEKDKKKGKKLQMNYSINDTINDINHMDFEELSFRNENPNTLREKDEIFSRVAVKRPQNVISPPDNAPQMKKCPSNSKTDYFAHSTSSKNFNTKEYPFEPLSNVIKAEDHEKVNKRKTIRAKVRYLDSLTLKKGSKGHFYSLDGCIKDGLSLLEVTFSTELVENFIGYTPGELSQKKKNSSSNPELKAALAEELSKVENLLKCMDGIMEIEFRKEAKPMVIHFRRMTEREKELDSERLKALKRKNHQ